MSTVKSKKLQVGTDATASNNFTIYQPATPDGTLRIGVGNADSPTEVAQFNSTGIVGDGSQLTAIPAPTQLSTATGSAPSYSARAWVNFNGTGTLSINDSANISSVTDGGTGDYRPNFTTEMPDSNYTVAGMARETSTGTSGFVRLSSFYTTTLFRVICNNNSLSAVDCEKVVLTIFR